MSPFPPTTTKDEDDRVALTADVKEELVAVDVSKTSVRAAELAALLRFSGGTCSYLALEGL